MSKDPLRIVLDDSLVEMADKRGRPRLRMKVDGAGAASIEFLDEAGTVVQRLQPTKSRHVQGNLITQDFRQRAQRA